MIQNIQAKLAPIRWRKLIPLAFITYSLAYLDRANYGFGAASGLAEDLNITPGISSLLGALFSWGTSFSRFQAEFTLRSAALKNSFSGA